MAEPATFSDRLRKGLVRIDAERPGGWDTEALASLRRSLDRTLSHLEPGKDAGADAFRFQLTGGKPLLFHGSEALPLGADRLCHLLNSMDIELLSAETLELDGELAAWLIRPEVNSTDTELRHVEETLRGLRSGRDRDPSAVQAADTMRVRLRSRLTQLVGALSAAQRDGGG